MEKLLKFFLPFEDFWNLRRFWASLRSSLSVFRIDDTGLASLGAIWGVDLVRRLLLSLFLIWVGFGSLDVF